MHDGIQLRGSPRPILLHPLQLGFVGPLKDPVARDVKSLLRHVFFDAEEDVSVVHTRGLEQTCQVFHAEMSVRAAVTLPRARRMLGQDLLARECRVPPAATVRVSSNIPVRVTDVVAVFFVEGIVGDEFEGLPPEDQAIFHCQSQAFEEKRVLQAAKMLEVIILSERRVEVPHAEWEMLRQCIN